MRITDIFLAIPYIVLAIAIATIFGRSENSVILVLGLTGWLAICRIVRAELPGAQAAGVRRGGTALGLHARSGSCSATSCPTPCSRSSSTAPSPIGGVILAEAALSFLGVGPQSADAGVGPDGRRGQGAGSLTSAPHMLFFPAWPSSSPCSPSCSSATASATRWTRS